MHTMLDIISGLIYIHIDNGWNSTYTHKLGIMLLERVVCTQLYIIYTVYVTYTTNYSLSLGIPSSSLLSTGLSTAVQLALASTVTSSTSRFLLQGGEGEALSHTTVAVLVWVVVNINFDTVRVEHNETTPLRPNDL